MVEPPRDQKPNKDLGEIAAGATLFVMFYGFVLGVAFVVEGTANGRGPRPWFHFLLKLPLIVLGLAAIGFALHIWYQRDERRLERKHVIDTILAYQEGGVKAKRMDVEIARIAHDTNLSNDDVRRLEIMSTTEMNRRRIKGEFNIQELIALHDLDRIGLNHDEEQAKRRWQANENQRDRRQTERTTRSNNRWTSKENNAGRRHDTLNKQRDRKLTLDLKERDGTLAYLLEEIKLFYDYHKTLAASPVMMMDRLFEMQQSILAFQNNNPDFAQRLDRLLGAIKQAQEKMQDIIKAINGNGKPMSASQQQAMEKQIADLVMRELNKVIGS